MKEPSIVGVWLDATRPKTLPAAVAPVCVGSALAWNHGAFVGSAALSCLGFALLVQIGTNFANDYFDFVKGADTAERVGPRRAVASGLIQPSSMKRAMCVVFGLAFMVGLSLLPHGGWALLVVGVASIASGYAYTGGPYPLGYNGLGDVFVFIFFGLIAVSTTYFVQAGPPTFDVWCAAAGIGALATNILVANNYRDVETDRRAGKRTTVVRFGRAFARAQFTLSHGVALAVPLVLWSRGLSPWILAPWLLLPMALGQIVSLRRAQSAPELIRLLGATGRYVALYALCLSAGLLLD